MAGDEAVRSQQRLRQQEYKRPHERKQREGGELDEKEKDCKDAFRKQQQQHWGRMQREGDDAALRVQEDNISDSNSTAAGLCVGVKDSSSRGKRRRRRKIIQVTSKSTSDAISSMLQSEQTTPQSSYFNTNAGDEVAFVSPSSVDTYDARIAGALLPRGLPTVTTAAAAATGERLSFPAAPAEAINTTAARHTVKPAIEAALVKAPQVVVNATAANTSGEATTAPPPAKGASVKVLKSNTSLASHVPSNREMLHVSPATAADNVEASATTPAASIIQAEDGTATERRAPQRIERTGAPADTTLLSSNDHKKDAFYWSPCAGDSVTVPCDSVASVEMEDACISPSALGHDATASELQKALSENSPSPATAAAAEICFISAPAVDSHAPAGGSMNAHRSVSTTAAIERNAAADAQSHRNINKSGQKLDTVAYMTEKTPETGVAHRVNKEATTAAAARRPRLPWNVEGHVVVSAADLSGLEESSGCTDNTANSMSLADGSEFPTSPSLLLENTQKLPPLLLGGSQQTRTRSSTSSSNSTSCSSSSSTSSSNSTSNNSNNFSRKIGNSKGSSSNGNSSSGSNRSGSNSNSSKSRSGIGNSNGSTMRSYSSSSRNSCPISQSSKMECQRDQSRPNCCNKRRCSSSTVSRNKRGCSDTHTYCSSSSSNGDSCIVSNKGRYSIDHKDSGLRRSSSLSQNIISKADSTTKRKYSNGINPCSYNLRRSSRLSHTSNNTNGHCSNSADSCSISYDACNHRNSNLINLHSNRISSSRIQSVDISGSMARRAGLQNSASVDISGSIARRAGLENSASAVEEGKDALGTNMSEGKTLSGAVPKGEEWKCSSSSSSSGKDVAEGRSRKKTVNSNGGLFDCTYSLCSTNSSKPREGRKSTSSKRRNSRGRYSIGGESYRKERGRREASWGASALQKDVCLVVSCGRCEHPQQQPQQQDDVEDPESSACRKRECRRSCIEDLTLQYVPQKHAEREHDYQLEEQHEQQRDREELECIIILQQEQQEQQYVAAKHQQRQQQPQQQHRGVQTDALPTPQERAVSSYSGENVVHSLSIVTENEGTHMSGSVRIPSAATSERMTDSVAKAVSVTPSGAAVAKKGGTNYRSVACCTSNCNNLPRHSSEDIHNKEQLQQEGDPHASNEQQHQKQQKPGQRQNHQIRLNQPQDADNKLCHLIQRKLAQQALRCQQAQQQQLSKSEHGSQATQQQQQPPHMLAEQRILLNTPFSTSADIFSASKAHKVSVVISGPVKPCVFPQAAPAAAGAACDTPTVAYADNIVAQATLAKANSALSSKANSDVQIGGSNLLAASAAATVLSGKCFGCASTSCEGSSPMPPSLASSPDTAATAAATIVAPTPICTVPTVSANAVAGASQSKSSRRTLETNKDAFASVTLAGISPSCAGDSTSTSSETSSLSSADVDTTAPRGSTTGCFLREKKSGRLVFPAPAEYVNLCGAPGTSTPRLISSPYRGVRTPQSPRRRRRSYFPAVPHTEAGEQTDVDISSPPDVFIDEGCCPCWCRETQNGSLLGNNTSTCGSNNSCCSDRKPCCISKRNSSKFSCGCTRTSCSHSNGDMEWNADEVFPDFSDKDSTDATSSKIDNSAICNIASPTEPRSCSSTQDTDTFTSNTPDWSTEALLRQAACSLSIQQQQHQQPQGIQQNQVLLADSQRQQQKHPELQQQQQKKQPEQQPHQEEKDEEEEEEEDEHKALKEAQQQHVNEVESEQQEQCRATLQSTSSSSSSATTTATTSTSLSNSSTTGHFPPPPDLPLAGSETSGRPSFNSWREEGASAAVHSPAPFHQSSCNTSELHTLLGEAVAAAEAAAAAEFTRERAAAEFTRATAEAEFTKAAATAMIASEDEEEDDQTEMATVCVVAATAAGEATRGIEEVTGLITPPSPHESKVSKTSIYVDTIKRKSMRCSDISTDYHGAAAKKTRRECMVEEAHTSAAHTPRAPASATFCKARSLINTEKEEEEGEEEIKEGWNALPLEIQIKVCCFLGAADLGRLAAAGHATLQVVLQQFVWKKVCEHVWWRCKRRQRRLQQQQHRRQRHQQKKKQQQQQQQAQELRDELHRLSRAGAEAPVSMTSNILNSGSITSNNSSDDRNTSNSTHSSSSSTNNNTEGLERGAAVVAAEGREEEERHAADVLSAVGRASNTFSVEDERPSETAFDTSATLLPAESGVVAVERSNRLAADASLDTVSRERAFEEATDVFSFPSFDHSDIGGPSNREIYRGQEEEHPFGRSRNSSNTSGSGGDSSSSNNSSNDNSTNTDGGEDNSCSSGSSAFSTVLHRAAERKARRIVWRWLQQGGEVMSEEEQQRLLHALWLRENSAKHRQRHLQQQQPQQQQQALKSGEEQQQKQEDEVVGNNSTPRVRRKEKVWMVLGQAGGASSHRVDSSRDNGETQVSGDNRAAQANRDDVVEASSTEDACRMHTRGCRSSSSSSSSNSSSSSSSRRRKRSVSTSSRNSSDSSSMSSCCSSSDLESDDELCTGSRSTGSNTPYNYSNVCNNGNGRSSHNGSHSIRNNCSSSTRFLRRKATNARRRTRALWLNIEAYKGDYRRLYRDANGWFPRSGKPTKKRANTGTWMGQHSGTTRACEQTSDSGGATVGFSMHHRHHHQQQQQQETRQQQPSLQGLWTWYSTGCLHESRDALSDCLDEWISPHSHLSTQGRIQDACVRTYDSCFTSPPTTTITPNITTTHGGGPRFRTYKMQLNPPLVNSMDAREDANDIFIVTEAMKSSSDSEKASYIRIINRSNFQVVKEQKLPFRSLNCLDTSPELYACGDDFGCIHLYSRFTHKLLHRYSSLGVVNMMAVYGLGPSQEVNDLRICRKEQQLIAVRTASRYPAGVELIDLHTGKSMSISPEKTKGHWIHAIDVEQDIQRDYPSCLTTTSSRVSRSSSPEFSTIGRSGWLDEEADEHYGERSSSPNSHHGSTSSSTSGNTNIYIGTNNNTTTSTTARNDSSTQMDNRGPNSSHVLFGGRNEDDDNNNNIVRSGDSVGDGNEEIFESVYGNSAVANINRDSHYGDDTSNYRHDNHRGSMNSNSESVDTYSEDEYVGSSSDGCNEAFSRCSSISNVLAVGESAAAGCFSLLRLDLRCCSPVVQEVPQTRRMLWPLRVHGPFVFVNSVFGAKEFCGRIRQIDLRKPSAAVCSQRLSSLSAAAEDESRCVGSCMVHMLPHKKVEDLRVMGDYLYVLTDDASGVLQLLRFDTKRRNRAALVTSIDAFDASEWAEPLRLLQVNPQGYTCTYGSYVKFGRIVDPEAAEHEAASQEVLLPPPLSLSQVSSTP